jgi:tRNA/rRNA methyltransferase
MSTSSTIDVNDGAPTVAGTRRTVAEIVAAAYRHGCERARALCDPPLSEAAVRTALAYCADEDCDRALAYCPGCRKHAQAAGIDTLDRFCAQFAHITLTDTGWTLAPGGPRPATHFANLTELASIWTGEEYWYLARRILHRLKKREQPRGKRMSGAAGVGPAPVVILVRPQLADNIGMAARAMANFGLEELRLVAPRDGWPNAKASAAASGANFVVDAAQCFDDMKSALVGLHWVAATTARQRDLVKPVLTPEQAAAEMRERIAHGQRCAVLFGPERTGLESEEIAAADAVVMAPVNPHFASLNVAHAVVVVSYEWMKARGAGTLGRVTSYDRLLQPGSTMRNAQPASREELLGFFEHLERELEAQGFFHPPHKRAVMVQNLRTMFTRMGATAQEIRTLRGIVTALVHGKGSARRLP